MIQINFLYFSLNGISIYERDNKGGTALHWASYYGSELSVNLMLSWLGKKVDGLNEINLQD